MIASSDSIQPVRWLAAVWLVALAGPVAAQETMQLPTFGEMVDVRVVNLEVVVTRRGERLEGLGVDDFRLSVDGEETPIEFFTEVADGRADRAMGNRYLVFVDDDFAIPSARNRVLREIADQVRLLGGEDAMAIVAFDGHRLDLLSHWTRSLARLRGVLADAQERRAYGLLRRSEQRRAVPHGRYGRRPSAGRSFSGTGFYGLGRTLAGPLEPEDLRYGGVHGRVSRVVGAAAAALRGFADRSETRPRGRRVMLLLAGGWPIYPRWGADAVERMESDRRLFAPLIDTANRLGYTLYPVDLQAGQGDTSAEVGTRAADRARAAVDLERDRHFEAALSRLAEETGGRALLAGARLAALARTIEDTQSYYWLGITPSWWGDGRERRVEVEVDVRSPGARVRARRSFSDVSRRAEVSMWIESAHLFDAPLPGAADLAARLGRPRSEGVGRIVVPLTLEVPFEHVTVAPSDGGFAARLELRVAATAADGARADVPVVPVLITSVEAPGPGATGIYETGLRLRRKPHRLLISLYDPLSGSVFSKRVEFEP